MLRGEGGEGGEVGGVEGVDLGGEGGGDAGEEGVFLGVGGDGGGWGVLGGAGGWEGGVEWGGEEIGEGGFGLRGWRLRLGLWAVGVVLRGVLLLRVRLTEWRWAVLMVIGLINGRRKFVRGAWWLRVLPIALSTNIAVW